MPEKIKGTSKTQTVPPDSAMKDESEMKQNAK